MVVFGIYCTAQHEHLCSLNEHFSERMIRTINRNISLDFILLNVCFFMCVWNLYPGSSTLTSLQFLTLRKPIFFLSIIFYLYCCTSYFDHKIYFQNLHTIFFNDFSFPFVYRRFAYNSFPMLKVEKYVKCLRERAKAVEKTA